MAAGSRLAVRLAIVGLALVLLEASPAVCVARGNRVGMAIRSGKTAARSRMTGLGAGTTGGKPVVNGTTGTTFPATTGNVTTGKPVLTTGLHNVTTGKPVVTTGMHNGTTGKAPGTTGRAGRGTTGAASSTGRVPATTGTTGKARTTGTTGTTIAPAATTGKSGSTTGRTTGTTGKVPATTATTASVSTAGSTTGIRTTAAQTTGSTSGRGGAKPEKLRKELKPGVIVFIVIVSVVACALVISLGYVLFKKKFAGQGARRGGYQSIPILDSDI
jgi:hypothetical protein